MDIYESIQYYVVEEFRKYVEKFDTCADQESYDSVEELRDMASRLFDKDERIIFAFLYGIFRDEDISQIMRKLFNLMDAGGEKILKKMEYTEGFDYHTVEFDKISYENEA